MKQQIIDKYIDRIKTDYPEDDKIQIDLEQFFQEMAEAKAGQNETVVMPEHDTPECEKCENRTALITGHFYYEPDDEPYNSEVEEDAEVEGGDAWVGGYKCDSCGHIQGLWHE